jgi:hypothetical protein
MKMSPETAQELHTLYENYFSVPERSEGKSTQTELPTPDEADPALATAEAGPSLNADRRFVQMLISLNNPEVTALILEAYQAYHEENNDSRLPPAELVVPAIMRLFEVAQEAIQPDELAEIYDKTRAWDFMGYLEDLIEENAPPAPNESTR